MPSRTLVATAVLFLIGGLGSGCEKLVEPAPLAMPDENSVREIGRSSGGLPITVIAPVAVHFNDPLILKLRITNVLDHPYRDDFDENSHTPDRFMVWLLCDRKAVPLTEYGEQTQPKETNTYSLIVSAQPKRDLEPGATSFKEIDLRQLFQISKPGAYTAIIERRPIWSNDDPRREIEAVKTSFTLLP